MSVIDARFGHVNVTAHDWRRLASFYTDVFGCTFVPPERDIRSADLDAATGLLDAHLTIRRGRGHADQGRPADHMGLRDGSRREHRRAASLVLKRDSPMER